MNAIRTIDKDNDTKRDEFTWLNNILTALVHLFIRYNVNEMAETYEDF